MKARLLKKLRKRFHWYRQEGRSCWFVIDKLTIKNGYAFVFNFYHVNDMLIYYMLREIGMLHHFVNLRDRKEKRNKQKIKT